MSSDDSSMAISDILNSEIKKLENKIDVALQNSSKLDISQIIPIYHQVLNVSSMKSVLKQFFKDIEPDNESKNIINNCEKLISKKFNSVLHQKFMAHLSDLISNSVSELKAQKNSQKTKTEIKNDASMYDKLRELMSTKEFVE